MPKQHNAVATGLKTINATATMTADLEHLGNGCGCTTCVLLHDQKILALGTAVLTSVVEVVDGYR